MANEDEAKSENKLINVFSRLFLMVIIFSLLVSLVMFVNWLNEPDNFPFKKVELVNRLENQESNELQMVAANALNGGFFSLNVDEFRAELLDKLPWVKSVSVRKVWPNKLLVEIVEFIPVVRWVSAENYLLSEKEGINFSEKKTDDFINFKLKNYQLLSQDGTIFEPKLTESQKLKFGKMALLSGPKISAKQVLERCVGISKDIKKLDLGIKHCGMNKRRTWKLSLIQNGDVYFDMKLGKEDVIQKLERFIKIFSGKLKQYLGSIESADLRYSNGFSIKWNTQHQSQNGLQKDVPNKSLVK
ncbi:MAG: FtsQ-type POTRA domain-containing protein [Gammaproteobacteria bacterium]|nr:FtsQ-type POTRA domain-containing protein [Gammaproteobacteria bacterium]